MQKVLAIAASAGARPKQLQNLHAKYTEKGLNAVARDVVWYVMHNSDFDTMCRVIADMANVVHITIILPLGYTPPWINALYVTHGKDLVQFLDFVHTHTPNGEEWVRLYLRTGIFCQGMWGEASDFVQVHLRMAARVRLMGDDILPLERWVEGRLIELEEAAPGEIPEWELAFWKCVVHLYLRMPPAAVHCNALWRTKRDLSCVNRSARVLWMANAPISDPLPYTIAYKIANYPLLLRDAYISTIEGR